MDDVKFEEYDIRLLREANDILCKVEGCNFGDPRRRQQVKRLSTIIKKLEELIEYKAEYRDWRAYVSCDRGEEG